MVGSSIRWNRFCRSYPWFVLFFLLMHVLTYLEEIPFTSFLKSIFKRNTTIEKNMLPSMFSYIYFILGWSTQDTWWWRVNPVSRVDKYAAKDDFVFRAIRYSKTKFEATPIPPCFCKSGGSTSWTSSLCSELIHLSSPFELFFTTVRRNRNMHMQF